MQINEIKNAIKQDDFLTFRKLLRAGKIDAATRAKLIRAVQSYIGSASQETYINALNGTDK